LVSHGHDEYRVVHEYSIEKITQFYKAGMRNNLDVVKQIAVGFRYANCADGKDFVKFLKSDPGKPEKPIDQNSISELMRMQGAGR